MIKIIIYLILTVGGLTLFKLGSGGTNISITAQYINIALSSISIAGIVCYLGSFLLWLNIVSTSQISLVFPIVTGIVTVLTFISGVVIFNEHVSAGKIMGLLVIIAGIVIMNIYK